MNKKQKSLTNKGFSLVELIIVIAIMAVLIGALAPQYVKYLDKSRLSADKQLADTIQQAIDVTLIDPDITNPTGLPSSYENLSAIPDASTNATGNAFWTAVYNTLGVSGPSDLDGKLKLDSTAHIQYKVTNGNASVQINGTGYSGTTAVEVN